MVAGTPASRLAGRAWQVGRAEPRAGPALLARGCANSSAAQKPWRLSSSVVVLASAQAVPDCELTLAPGRQCRAFDYRICCARRAGKSSFMPDVIVFPGGAVEQEDRRLAADLLGTEDLEATLRCAAIREAFEESGVGVFSPALGLAGRPEEFAAWRAKVRKDASEMRNLCAELKTKPAAGALHYLCSFITPDMEHVKLKRGGFDARFYAFCADAEQVSQAAADQQETVQLLWLSPDDALQAVDEGKITMVPPQWYIFKELFDSCPTMASVPSYASSPSRQLQRDYPIKPYLVALSKDEQAAFLRCKGRDPATNKEPVFSLCYPGDEAHPVFPGPRGTRHRMLMCGTFGGKLQFELQRDSVPLPLKEARQGWYSLAKL